MTDLTSTTRVPLAPPLAPPVAPSRRRRELTFAAAFLLSGLAIGLAMGPAAGALAFLSGDKVPWTASRVMAFLAYLAFGGSVAYGLAMASGLIDALAGRPVSFTLHRDLSIAGLILTAAHVFLLLGDKWIGFSLQTLLIPGMSPYEPIPVAIGQIAAIAAILVTLTFYLRGLLGPKLWRSLHTLSIVVFALATVHGLLAGSDSKLDAVWWLYVGVTLLIVFLLVYRVANRGAVKLRPARAGV
jgi:methionine sulfoxide reductase heme-binding subunit